MIRNSKLPQLSTEQSLECEKCITEKKLFEVLKSMPNDKSHGNDSLTKELFETLWSKSKKKTKRKHFYHVFYALLVQR